MRHGKYIIKEVQGNEVPILFSHLISHCDIGIRGNSRGKDVAAGFFSVTGVIDDPECDIVVDCWGKSESMEPNLESRGTEDEKLIKKMLKPTY